MKIDRKKAETSFRRYVADYNAEEEKVRLKIEHTFRVAKLCDRIAVSLGMEGAGVSCEAYGFSVGKSADSPAV